MNPLITCISLAASTIGIAGIVPQITQMRSTRSSAGQSRLGWIMGVAASAGLAFVNIDGYGAWLLAAGNIISCTGCLAALYLAHRYRHPGAIPGPLAPADLPLDQLHTGEFEALRDTVIEEHRRRTGEPALAFGAGPPSS